MKRKTTGQLLCLYNVTGYCVLLCNCNCDNPVWQLSKYTKKLKIQNFNRMKFHILSVNQHFKFLSIDLKTNSNTLNLMRPIYIIGYPTSETGGLEWCKGLSS